jgi:hypothetical protein
LKLKHKNFSRPVLFFLQELLFYLFFLESIYWQLLAAKKWSWHCLQLKYLAEYFDNLENRKKLLGVQKEILGALRSAAQMVSY